MRHGFQDIGIALPHAIMNNKYLPSRWDDGSMPLSRHCECHATNHDRSFDLLPGCGEVPVHYLLGISWRSWGADSLPPATQHAVSCQVSSELRALPILLVALKSAKPTK